MSSSTIAHTQVDTTGSVPAGRPAAAGLFLAAYLVIVSALVVVGLLVTQVLDGGTIGRWDEDATRWLSLHRDGALNAITEVVSRSADTLGIVAAALVVVIVLWTRDRRDLAAMLVTALALELSVFLTVNAIVGRERPDVVPLGSTPTTGSFPSGHTAATVVLYGAIALAVSSTARTYAWRVASWLAAVVMALAVGFSRVYRGFHYPTDVVFGLVLGCAALAVAVLAVRAWRAARPEVRA